MGIQSYRELRAWQVAMDLAVDCYNATRSFPKEELYGLTSQIRRAAASVPANIAEGYGRKTRGEYIQFLYIAQGSLKELETHWLLAERVQLVDASTVAPVLASCEAVEIARRSNRLLTADVTPHPNPDTLIPEDFHCDRTQYC